MYLTAQRVRSRARDEGINAFLYLHQDRAQALTWAPPDIDVIADRHPGTLHLQRLELDFGMNDVLSYLDVAAPDAIDIEALRAILASQQPRTAGTWSDGPVALRFFYANANRRNPVSEFEALRDHVLALLPHRGIAFPATTAALTIVAEDNEGIGLEYYADEVAQARIQQLAPGTRTARVRVAYDVRQGLVEFLGQARYRDEIARIVTGLDVHRLSSLGGATIVHAEWIGSEASEEALATQVEGDWLAPEDMPEAPTGWPTGAILSRGDYALDLIYIERAWYPLSEAGLYTHLHSTGLKAGEPWRFVTRTTPPKIYRVSLGPSLTVDGVRAQYGAEAAMRCRADVPTVQLHLVEDHA